MLFRSIGVPPGPRPDRLDIHVRVSLALARDRIDFGVSLLVAVEHVADGRVAETPRERDVLRVVEVLIAEEHDLPPQQRRPDRFDGMFRQRPPQMLSPQRRQPLQRYCCQRQLFR